MENFDINSLDVKTIRLLLAINQTGSVSKAADMRGMTQSTASYGLEKLRYAFSDPLFIRAGRGVVPTTNGALVIEQCQEIVDQLDRLTDLKTFNPREAERDFVMGAAGLETETVLVPFNHHLRKVARNCRLVIHGQDLKNRETRLEDDWDLALSAYPGNSNNLKSVSLFEDEYVTFYDPDIREAPVTLDDFCNAAHVITLLGGKSTTLVDDCLKNLGRKRSVDLIVNQFESLPSLMRGTDLIATIPSRFSDGLMREFTQTACPVSLPKLTIQMVWHMRKDSDPAHIWLRNEIKSLMKRRK